MKKHELRTVMKQTLRDLSDRGGRSVAVWQNLERLEEFQQAVLSHGMIAVYVSLHEELEGEVETARFFDRITCPVAVPYCERGELELFHLQALKHPLDELEPQTLGILEPRSELRADPSRRVLPEELALVVTPGLAFDRTGGRLGRGGGYYDRVFARIDSKREKPVPKIALAFDCQILDQVPVEPHDIRLDGIITESEIIRCRTIIPGRLRFP